MIEYNGLKVFWDGHASVRLQDQDFTVAIDPCSAVSGEFEAGIVLITHEDESHFDPEKLEQICGDRTCVVLPESMKEVEAPCRDTEYIEQGGILDIYNVEIESVPMYNDHHEKGKGTGYRIEMAGTSIYIAGDTGVIDEAWDLENRVDLAFLPVEGVYTMDIEEAVKMAVRVKPDTVIPYHYGEPFFKREEVNLKSFEAGLDERNIRCQVLDRERK